MTGERGSAALELALVLPLVLVVALAALQVALLGKDALLVANAAREGAREAAVTTDESRVRQAAVRDLDDERAEVTVERAGSVGDPVTVEVRYDAPLAVPFLEWLLPASVELRSAATMRQEAAA